MKAQRCAAEVKLLGNGDEVTQMTEFNFLIHTQNILMPINKILDILFSER
jgi:hypothetical protein